MSNMNDTCNITVQLGDKIVQNSTSPMVFARVEFEQLVRQFSKDTRPLKVKCTRKEYTEEGRELESILSFENNMFVEAFRKKEKK